MPTIRQLSPSVINKIAAGEVIERPASVVKELVENAVDAGSTRIDVALEKGGTEVIRVADNGYGIALDQLPLVVASHATSKIESADDLFSVSTLGFRGEAMASIASVSRMTIRSRAEGTREGGELEIIGGELQPVALVGCPQGTTTEVRNLFFNTPVRQKFLRTVQTESGHATEALTKIALAHPGIHFSLTNNCRVMHDLPPTADLVERIAALLGEEISSNLIQIESENDGVRLSGYVANPMQSRANNRLQYLFLNGRAIRDRALQHALGEAYRGLLLTGRHPICFLNLEIPPESVDVNVHPTKQEVRFQDSGKIYSQLLGTLRTRFLTTDLKARVQTPGGASSISSEQEAEGASQLVAWAKEQLEQSALQLQPSESEPHTDRAPSTYTPGQPLELHHIEKPAFSDPAMSRPLRDELADEAATYRFDGREKKALQIHNRYLLVETDSGVEVIDQHALHERILYERMREKVASEALESQRLLVPEPVDLSASEAATILDQADLLSRLGFEVKPFGGETVLVSSHPVMLANMSPAEAIRTLAEKLEIAGSNPEPTELLDELLHGMACKAAVKFGDPLAQEEIDALLAQRHLIRDQHHCPHGRPTTLVFTREELDRQFKRV